MGLMQVMPETYKEMRAQYGLGKNAYNPRDNVLAGAAYLRFLYKRYGYPAMFAAYNDGPGNLEDHLYRGRALPAETRNYVKGIARFLGRKGPALGDKPGTTVALTRPDGRKIAIDGARVTSIRAPLPGEYATGVHAVLTVGRKKQGVRESVAEVMKATGHTTL
jgi:hypothetical protein